VTVHVARLDAVCEINPRMPKTLADDDAVSFLPMAAVSEDGYIDFEEQREAGKVKKGYTYFERGDVLIAKITPCFENGKATRTEALANPVGFGSTEFHVLRAGREIDQSYLFHLIWNSKFREVGAKNMTGSAGQKRVPADFLKRLEIPLPPLDEQQRIAAILDKADDLRRKRKRAIDMLEGLTQSVFLKMFGDLTNKNSLHNWVKLGDLCVEKAGIKAGPFGSSIKKEDYAASGYRVYGQEQVIGGTLTIGDYYIPEAKFRALESCAVAAGDVLVSLVGSFGRVLVVPDRFEAGIINPRLIRLRPNRKIARSSFVKSLLESPSVQHELKGKSRGGTMGILNAGLLRDLDVVLPPLDTQDRFEELIARVQVMKSFANTALSVTNSMFTSLQSRAFSGQL